MPDTGVSCDVATPTDSKREKEYVDKPVSFRRRLRRWLWHVVARQLTLLCIIAVVVAGWFGRRRRRLLPSEGCEIMLTGRFDSDNWILAFLSALSASKECSRLWMVSTNLVPTMPKVVAIYPPKWLTKVMGVTQARLLTFLWGAIRKRPHVVGGFHIMVNGIAAAIVGRLVGARSIYFCVGGPAEIWDGGIHSADSYFTRMETPDNVVEKRLARVVSKFDTIITMGAGAVSYFRDKGVNTDLCIVPGSIDPRQFCPAERVPTIDLIMTGRLVPVKRIDVFLYALKSVVNELPDVKAVIVGEGRLRGELQQLAMDMGIDCNVSIVGYQRDLISWLQASRVFILTSDSEGLSLSMTEAMMCGLPVVVSDVGDLKDLVDDGVNGYLVPRRSPEQFAARIIDLLSNSQKLEAFSQAARSSALRYATEAATAKWDNIIKHYRTS